MDSWSVNLGFCSILEKCNKEFLGSYLNYDLMEYNHIGVYFFTKLSVVNFWWNRLKRVKFVNQFEVIRAVIYFLSLRAKNRIQHCNNVVVTVLLVIQKHLKSDWAILC